VEDKKPKSTAQHRQERMLDLLEDCQKILGRKKGDYGIDNFIEAAKFLQLATGTIISPMEVAYVLAGIKLSRIKTLRNQGTIPNHETIEDSVKDLINYIALETRERERYETSETTDEKGQASSP